MNTQQNQNEIKKKGVQVNPSRDIKYEEKEKDFSGEFSEEEDVKASGEDVNPSELDKSEVEFGQENAQPSEPGKPGKPNQEQSSAFDQAVKNAGSNNSPDVGMSSDLGGDASQIQKH